MNIKKGDSLDLLLELEEKPSLVVTDPPYAFGGDVQAHAISATVAIVLRESAKRLQRGGWMVVMCASSWRSISYMVESVRGIVQPVRLGTWAKPESRTKVSTKGWKWASVAVIAFRKGKARELEASSYLDHVEASTVKDGRIAQLPEVVADWMVKPYAKAGDLMLDPFAGSGALCAAAERVDAGHRIRGRPFNYERRFMTCDCIRCKATDPGPAGWTWVQNYGYVCGPCMEEIAEGLLRNSQEGK